MVRLLGVTEDGKEQELQEIEHIKLNINEDDASDYMTAVICGEIAEEMKEILLFGGDDLIYRGIVDEQRIVFTDTAKTEFVSRSVAAILEDNEVCAKSYKNINGELIFEIYARPLGFTKCIGGEKTVMGDFVVVDGSSRYDVLKKYAEAVGEKLRIDNSEVRFGSAERDSEAVFSNTGGINFERAEYSRKRKSLVSKVRVKTHKDGQYEISVNDERVSKKGICREKLVDASDEDTREKIDRKISKNTGVAYETVTIYCKGRFVGLLGVEARVCAGVFEQGGYYVGGVEYTFDKYGEKTRLELVKKEKYSECHL